MEEEEKRELCEQLSTIDASLFFIGVLVVAIFLSWKGTAIQREGLCAVIQGKQTSVPVVFSIRLTVSALVIGALVFFFCLAQEILRSAQCQTAAEQCSALRNMWAALLTLAAALIRLCDLLATQGSTQEEEEASR